MNNHLTYVLVADASKAKLFSTYKAKLLQTTASEKDLHLIASFSHEDSRKKGVELASDKMGGFNTGTFVEATSPKTQEAIEFAQELMDFIETERTKNLFRELIIIAPPAFMGMLNKAASSEIQKLISQTIEKDYTPLDDRNLLQQLQRFL